MSTPTSKNTPTVPRDLQLPPSQRAESTFREQRRQKLKEHLLKKKTFLSNQENQTSRKDQSVMSSQGQIQQETKILKLKTNMTDKENIGKHTGSKNNLLLEKTSSPLTPSKSLTNSTTVVDSHNSETLKKIPIKDDPQSQHMTLSKVFHLKNNNNKMKPTTAEKPKQDTNMPKKPALGSYRGQIVQAKVNSFRKPLPVKDDSSVVAKKLPATFSSATKSQPVNTSGTTVASGGVSTVRTATKFVSSTCQNRLLVRPPIRNNLDKNQDSVKHSTFSRTTANVTIRNRPLEKESQLQTITAGVKATSSQDVRINKALSRHKIPETVSRVSLSSNLKLIDKSKTADQHRHIRTATDGIAAWSRERAEERKARLSEWRIGKGRALKRPPSSVVTQPRSGLGPGPGPRPGPIEQNGKPAESFWTAMAEEDEQRLFTEKVNKTFSGCLNLISEGCPREEILVILNDLIKEIPDAKKLVKYWICLARIEPITSPVENIFTIYEKAILTGAQPLEEMRSAIVDILAMRNQEKVNSGENIEDTSIAKEQIQQVNIEDTDVTPDPEKPEMKDKCHKNVAFQVCEKTEDEDTIKTPGGDVKTPNAETSTSCLIKYNVSTTPHLQSVKKKMQIDELNTTFKELKFLTPVRRSQRLQNNSSKLPDMLKDHYPCVSSLEELSELGNETDAFICRPNTALYRMVLDAKITEEE